MNRVRVTMSTAGIGTLAIDDMDISKGVRGFSIRGNAGHVTEVELDMTPRQAAEFDGMALVRLTPEFESFLMTLGWRPPVRGVDT